MNDTRAVPIEQFATQVLDRVTYRVLDNSNGPITATDVRCRFLEILTKISK